MKILVVDDFITNVSVLRVTLSKIGHTVFTARDGVEAIAVLKSEPVDVVLTDWMMPNLDGPGLIRWIRSSMHPAPLIVVITALRINEAEDQALKAGADVFMVKPVSPAQIGSMLNDFHAKKEQRAEPKYAQSSPAPSQAPNFCGIAFGAGTGGAFAVRRIFGAMGSVPQSAAFFIVLHGPGWAAEAMAEQLCGECASSTVVIPKDNEKVKPGTIYIAPGDKHMVISPNGLTITLEQTPHENFYRPSIDPLFRSIAEVFGRRGIGVVLAGTGIDGYIGSGHIQVAHGTVIVQKPTQAVASQMTQNVITLGLATQVLSLSEIGGALLEQLRKFQDSRATAAPLVHTISRIAK